MSEQVEKTRKARAKRWTEGEAREVLREWQESGLSAVKFGAQRNFSAARLSYWEVRHQQGCVSRLIVITDSGIVLRQSGAS